MIRDDPVYTVNDLAEIFDHDTDWVFEHIIDGGCPARKIGDVHVVTGEDFRLWVESEAHAT